MRGKNVGVGEFVKMGEDIAEAAHDFISCLLRDKH